MVSDLHGKIVKTFIIRLVLYTTGSIASVIATGYLMYLLNTLAIPMTIVVPVAIALFAMAFAVWWLWHDTKREIMQEHMKDQRPKK